MEEELQLENFPDNENEKLPSASRRLNMSRIHSKNTKPEIMLRKALWKKNLRFRIHTRQIPGKPDIFIKKYRLVIFIDGGFWHGYEWPAVKARLKTNIDFWVAKIERNIARDRANNHLLLESGYTVMRFWDHQILKELDKCVNQIMLYVESSCEGTIPENFS